MSMDFLSALEFLDTNWDSCMNEDIFEAANSSSFDAISEKELYYQNQAELLQSQFLKQSLNQSQFEDLQKKINTASKQVHQNAEIVSKAVETISQLIPKENEANTEYVIQNNAISEAQTFFDSIWPIIRDNQNRFFPKLKTLIDKVSFQKSDPVLFLEYLGKVQKVVHFLKSHQELNQIPKLHDEINNFNENFQSIVTKLQNEIIHSFSDQVDNTTHEYINFYLDFVDYDFTKIEIIIKKCSEASAKAQIRDILGKCSKKSKDSILNISTFYYDKRAQTIDFEDPLIRQMIENESIRFPQGFLIENKPIEIIIPYFISTLPDGINNRIRDLRELFGNALRKINRHIDIVSYFCKHLEKEFKNGLKMNVFGSKTIVPKAKNNDPMFWCFLFYIMVFHFNNHQFDDHKQITEDITEYIIELSLERSNDLFRSYINELSKEYQSIKKLLMKNPEQINKLQSFYLDSIYPIFKITDLLYDKIVRFRDNMKIHWYDSVIKNYFKENCWFMDFDTEVKKFMKFEELDQISPLPAILLLFVLIEKLEGVKVPIKTHLVNQVNNFTKEFLKKYDIAFVFSTKKLINNKIQTFNDEQLLQIYPKLIKAAVGYITTIRDFLVQKGNLQEETIQQFIQITCTYLQNSYNNFYDCVKEIMFKFSEDQEIKTPKQFTEELNKQF